MLIIVEGPDKSGKSTIVKILQKMYNAILIRKQYCEHLYPIDYGKASLYDWQAILDRVVLANPDQVFIADRSFFTQTAYQLATGHDEYAITDEQWQAFCNYCKTVSSIKHLVILCEADYFEIDHIVDSIDKRDRIVDAFKKLIYRTDDKIDWWPELCQMPDCHLNSCVLYTSAMSLADQIKKADLLFRLSNGLPKHGDLLD